MREGENIGQIIQIIGPVDIMKHFYEYQLYKKGLYISNSKINKICNKPPIISSLPFAEDIRSEYCFTIDPKGCRDFDDAFSIMDDTTTTTEITVGIHIANVAVVLDYMQAWSLLTERVSTLYMPDKNHHMLPTTLSEGVCSLSEGNERVCFSLLLTFSKATNEIIRTHFCTSLIRIAKNFEYEEPELLSSIPYQTLKCISNQHDSHTVVEYFMKTMNYISSQRLKEMNTGIFRRTTMKESQHIFGEYVGGGSCEGGGGVGVESLQHVALNLPSYVHITSPIRRLVDVLNMIAMMRETMSSMAITFYEKWITKLEYINTMSKAGQKVQNDCSLLHMCLTDDSMLDKKYSAIVSEKVEGTENKYSVFIKELKLTSTIKRETPLIVGETIEVKLMIFEKENSFKKKIRTYI